MEDLPTTAPFDPAAKKQLELNLPIAKLEDAMQPDASAQIGDRVSFRISDVFLPEPSEVLANLTSDVETKGVVEEFSDSGERPRAYALVRITAQQAVLLPVGALHVLEGK